MLKLAMTVLWPSFLSAILAAGLFFSTFDPLDLMLAGGQPELPPIAAYTVGFFFFWVLAALASMLRLYLYKADDAPKQPPF